MRPDIKVASLLTNDIDYLEAMLGAKSIETAWALHSRKMRDYGFDRLIYGANRFYTFDDFSDKSDWVVLTNHDKAYIDVFFGRALYFHAPMAIWAAQNTGVCSWQWAIDQRQAGQFSKPQCDILDLNEKMGVVAGYSISFDHISERFKAGIGLCAKRGMSQADVEDIWASKGQEILILNSLMNLKVSTLPHEGPGKPLTARQREVLQWIADGKTAQDTATIMGLNLATVEKHLRLARERLVAETTAQAVMKASLQNQFFIFEGLRRNNIALKSSVDTE